jgi:hypothetical protein
MLTAFLAGCLPQASAAAPDDNVEAILKAIKEIGVCVYGNQVYSNGARLCMSEGFGAMCKAPSTWVSDDDPSKAVNAGCKNFKPVASSPTK